MSAVTASPDAAEEILGSTLPRIWTPPLITGEPGECGCGCALSRETSWGFLLVDFAAAIGWAFDPWQRFVAIHIGEILPDGRPRFRKVLIIVARQNGKTVLSRVLILFWMFIQKAELVIGTHTDRGEAKLSWQATVDMAESVPWLVEEMPKSHQRLQIGEEVFWNNHGSKYRFKAPNRRAGRGGTVRRALLDELREHHNRETLTAVEGAMSAAKEAQLVMISNQGDRRAVVLKTMRQLALSFIDAGVGDPRIGLFEYSAPPGSKPTDARALAMANPDYGNRVDPDALMGLAIQAEMAGGEDLDDFLTEYMCIATDVRNPAIDLNKFAALGPQENEEKVTLADHRNKLALCVDVAPDGAHVTLSGAAVIDELVHVHVLKAWASTAEARRELPGIVAKIRPRVVGWMPKGPSAVLAADLANPKHKPFDAEGRRVKWPPPRVKLIEITSDGPTVCMGFDEQITSQELRHDGHKLALTQASNTIRLNIGESGWVFARREAGHVDCIWSMAGAVHLARTLPPPPPPLTAS